MRYAGFGKKLHHETPAWVTDGARFHIRIRAAATTPQHLTDPSLARSLLDSVAIYQAQQRWHTTIFLLMPDHLHAILSFPAQEEMSKTIGQWKRFHARASGVVWQDNFFDHRLRNPAEADLKFDYIRRNPVVQGLSRSPEDWPWWIAMSPSR